MTTFAAAMSRGLALLYSKSGERARYKAADGFTQDCTVMIERDLSTYGDTIEVSGASAVISVRRCEMEEMPTRGSVFEILDTGEEFTFARPASADELEHRVLVG